MTLLLTRHDRRGDRHRDAYAAAQPQQPRDAARRSRRPGTALLGGVVTSQDDSARPLRRALVTLSGSASRVTLRLARGGVQVTTDDSGRFAFSDLPAGRYTITAEKPAYVKSLLRQQTGGTGTGNADCAGRGAAAEQPRDHAAPWSGHRRHRLRRERRAALERAGAACTNPFSSMASASSSIPRALSGPRRTTAASIGCTGSLQVNTPFGGRGPAR